VQIVREEMGDYLEGVELAGPYEDEDLAIVVKLRKEPADFEERNKRMRRRIDALGHDVNIFVEFLDAETITV
jgi:hypothetical protein